MKQKSKVNLWEAVEQGNVKKVNQGLVEGLNPNQSYGIEGADYLLHEAMKLGIDQNGEEIITILLKAGASLTQEDDNGLTPIQYAAGYYGSVSKIKLLLAHGGNIKERNWDKENLLFHAIEAYKFDVFQFLLEAGVNPQQKNKSRKTPFDEVKRIFELLNKEDFLKNKPLERENIKKMATLLDMKSIQT